MRMKGMLNTTVNAVPNRLSQTFYGMDDAKEIWAAIKTRFGEVLQEDRQTARGGLILHVQFDKIKANFQLPQHWHFAMRASLRFKGRSQAGSRMLIDCGMSSTVKIGLGYGIKQMSEYPRYEEEISSRFKQVEYKGVPHPLSGDYTPREQEDIDDSLYEYGKYGPQPQSPSTTESDASSTVYSTCQSNDMMGNYICI
ncbi:hypothetical protein Tco_1509962 [Tanacetum coccineum]